MISLYFHTDKIIDMRIYNQYVTKYKG